MGTEGYGGWGSVPAGAMMCELPRLFGGVKIVLF